MTDPCLPAAPLWRVLERFKDAVSLTWDESHALRSVEAGGVHEGSSGLTRS